MIPRINLPLVGATVSGRWPLSLMKGIDRHALDTRDVRSDLQSRETTEFVEKDCESPRTGPLSGRHARYRLSATSSPIGMLADASL